MAQPANEDIKFRPKFRPKTYAPPPAPTTSYHLRLPQFLVDWFRIAAAEQHRTAHSLMVQVLFEGAEQMETARINQKQRENRKQKRSK